MKKTSISLLVLGALTFAGTGCSTFSPTPSTHPTTTSTLATASTTSSLPSLDIFTLNDNRGAIPVQLLNNQIKEIAKPRDISFDPEHSYQETTAVRFYQSGTAMFALTQHSGSMSLISHVQDNPSARTGIWYAAPWTNKRWQWYADIGSSDSTGVIKNNPFHLWSEGKRVNLLTIDYGGAGSGEGIAKILSSEDGGATWFISSCFYYSEDLFPEIKNTDHLKRANFASYLNKTMAAKNVKPYVFNAKNGQFEQKQFDKTTGESEFTVVDGCLNIAPTKAISAEKYNAGMIADGATRVTLPLEISRNEPEYNITIVSASTSTPASVSITRGNNGPTQRLTLPSIPQDTAWRLKNLPTAFVFRDINFDGYADIGFTIDGGAKWGAEQYWLFDPKTKKFITNQLTSDLRAVAHNEIRFDTTTERILTNNFIGAGIYKKTTYAIQNGRLKMTEDYEQQPVYKNDQPTGECSVTTTRAIGTKPKITHETLNEMCPGYQF